MYRLQYSKIFSNRIPQILSPCMCRILLSRFHVLNTAVCYLLRHARCRRIEFVDGDAIRVMPACRHRFYRPQSPPFLPNPPRRVSGTGHHELLLRRPLLLLPVDGAPPRADGGRVPPRAGECGASLPSRWWCGIVDILALDRQRCFLRRGGEQAT